jgi:hypothetical protein
LSPDERRGEFGREPAGNGVKIAGFLKSLDFFLVTFLYQDKKVTKPGAVSIA